MTWSFYEIDVHVHFKSLGHALEGSVRSLEGPLSTLENGPSVFLSLSK